MNRRLLGALQRGGVATQARNDRWAVRRCSDCRRRVIGTLSGAEIDVLRLHRFLISRVTSGRREFVWGGGLAVSEKRTELINALMRAESEFDAILDSLILTWRNPTERGRVVDLLLALRDDARRWNVIADALSNEDLWFLKRLCAWRSNKAAFARSEGLRLSVIEQKAVSVFRAASGSEEAHTIANRKSSS